MGRRRRGEEIELDIPSSQHLNQMLLRRASLPSPSQSRKDPILRQQRPARRPLDLNHLGLIDVRPGGDGVEIEVLAEDDDAGAVLEHVARGTGHGGFDAAGGVVVVGGGDGLSDCAEEFEHVL